jgi:uncharacterized protein
MSQQDFTRLYEVIVEQALHHDACVKRLLLGLNWSVLELEGPSGHSTGICFSPLDTPRNLPWPGSLRGRPVQELAGWISRWDPTEAVVGTAVCNAAIELAGSCAADARWLHNSAPGHLKVFEHFASQLAGKQVVIIGRYPGMERFDGRFEYHCIERRGSDNTLPDAAANFLIPQADWVFITASSIANKTLPQLLSLCALGKQTHTLNVVLMGPSLPWLRQWADFGVDYLAGVTVNDPDLLHIIAAEAGGTRIFEQSVGYRLLAF